jgi:glycosyltransferase involved in cell wall biosynthesis
MRVCLISSYFSPHKGGSQKYAEELYVKLLQLYPDFQVDVICYNTDNALKIEKHRGMTIYRVSSWQILPGQFALPNYLELWQLAKHLKKQFTYDVVNSQTRFFDNSWWAPLLAKYFKAKSVLTDHCADTPTHSSAVVTAIARLVDRLWSPIILNWYDKVTVTNKATQKFIQNLTSKSPLLMYGGVDTKYFFPLSKPVSKKITVTFVGRMIPSKGPQILFEAIQRLLPKYSDVDFIFAGGGEVFDQLKKHESAQVHFLGSVDSKQVRDVLQQSDILVHPSLHSEGFPNVLLEAGASGCAVIATDQGGSTEIIQDQVTGLIVTPTPEEISQSIELLLENPKLRSQLANKLHKHILSNFEWEPLAHQFYLHVLK